MSPNGSMTEEEQRQIAESEARITTEVDIRPVLDRKRDALMTHASQITDSWFSKIPPEIVESAFGYETFIRVRNETQAPVPETRPVRWRSLGRAGQPAGVQTAGLVSSGASARSASPAARGRENR